MLAEQNKFPNNFMETTIFIDQGVSEEARGYLLHREKAWRFESMLELMKLYESMFEVYNFPQQTHKLRINEDQKNKNLEDWERSAMEANKIPSDNKPTFVVKVNYRQNASWQGSIRWLEKDIEKNFRSTLELIKLMDSAVESDNDTGWE